MPLIALLLFYLLSACNPPASCLGLDQQGQTLILEQRQQITYQDIQIKLGDISQGQVQLSLTQEQHILLQGSLRVGQSLSFIFQGCALELHCQRFIEHLIRADSAVLILRLAGEDDRQKIEMLLQRIAQSPDQFIRNGQSYDGPAAAAHLRRKYQQSQEQIPNLQTFIQHIGSRSSSSGQEYEVLLPNGQKIKAQDWLDSLAQDL